MYLSYNMYYCFFSFVFLFLTDLFYFVFYFFSVFFPTTIFNLWLNETLSCFPFLFISSSSCSFFFVFLLCRLSCRCQMSWFLLARSLDDMKRWMSAINNQTRLLFQKEHGVHDDYMGQGWATLDTFFFAPLVLPSYSAVTMSSCDFYSQVIYFQGQQKVYTGMIHVYTYVIIIAYICQCCCGCNARFMFWHKRPNGDDTYDWSCSVRTKINWRSWGILLRNSVFCFPFWETLKQKINNISL